MKERKRSKKRRKERKTEKGKTSRLGSLIEALLHGGHDVV